MTEFINSFKSKNDTIFVFRIDEILSKEELVTTSLTTSNYDYVKLILKNESLFSIGYDIMEAWSKNDTERRLFIGHWNDGC